MPASAVRAAATVPPRDVGHRVPLRPAGEEQRHGLAAVRPGARGRVGADHVVLGDVLAELLLRRGTDREPRVGQRRSGGARVVAAHRGDAARTARRRTTSRPMATPSRPGPPAAGRAARAAAGAATRGQRVRPARRRAAAVPPPSSPARRPAGLRRRSGSTTVVSCGRGRTSAIRAVAACSGRDPSADVVGRSVVRQPSCPRRGAARRGGAARRARAGRGRRGRRRARRGRRRRRAGARPASARWTRRHQVVELRRDARGRAGTAAARCRARAGRRSPPAEPAMNGGAPVSSSNSTIAGGCRRPSAGRCADG